MPALADAEADSALTTYTPAMQATSAAAARNHSNPPQASDHELSVNTQVLSLICFHVMAAMSFVLIIRGLRARNAKGKSQSARILSPTTMTRVQRNGRGSGQYASLKSTAVPDFFGFTDVTLDAEEYGNTRERQLEFVAKDQHMQVIARANLSRRLLVGAAFSALTAACGEILWQLFSVESSDCSVATVFSGVLYTVSVGSMAGATLVAIWDVLKRLEQVHGIHSLTGSEASLRRQQQLDKYARKARVAATISGLASSLLFINELYSMFGPMIKTGGSQCSKIPTLATLPLRFGLLLLVTVTRASACGYTVNASSLTSHLNGAAKQSTYLCRQKIRSLLLIHLLSAISLTFVALGLAMILKRKDGANLSQTLNQEADQLLTIEWIFGTGLVGILVLSLLRIIFDTDKDVKPKVRNASLETVAPPVIEPPRAFFLNEQPPRYHAPTPYQPVQNPFADSISEDREFLRSSTNTPEPSRRMVSATDKSSKKPKRLSKQSRSNNNSTSSLERAHAIRNVVNLSRESVRSKMSRSPSSVSSGLGERR